MTTDEFEQQARQIGDRILVLPDDQRIAAACRGSANPAALAWLGEALGLSTATSLVDLGAGMGGPLAWFRLRYDCAGIAMEPSGAAASVAATLFGLVVLRASGESTPFRDGGFDTALMLGVVSVVDDALRSLREARRVGRRLGVLDYCSTGPSTVTAGGSHFPTPARLKNMLAATGWSIDQAAPVAIDAPATWRDAVDRLAVEPARAEREVVAAIESGAIAPFMVVAR
ncbi:MAG: class I SAM-dependent methyltransferase [Acidimicrobiia bacterium]